MKLFYRFSKPLFSKSFWALAALAVTNICSLSADYVSAGEVVVGQNASGGLITAWSVYDNVNENYVIRARVWDSINGWSTATTISETPGTSFSPLLAMNSAGDAAVIWTSLGQSESNLLAGRIYYQGSWDASPTAITEEYAAVTACKLQINDNGDIVLGWVAEPLLNPEPVIYTLTGSSVSSGWNVPSGIQQVSD